MGSPAAKAKMPTLAPGSRRTAPPQLLAVGWLSRPGTHRASRAGNQPGIARARARGFSMIELLIVIAIIAVAVSVVSVALPDREATKLEEEGARLLALLEMARAEARVAGVPVRWQPRSVADASPLSGGRTAGGQATAEQAEADFVFSGLPASVKLGNRWLDRRTSAEVIGARLVVLGPDAILPAQRIVLRLGEHRFEIATDGLAPFSQVGAAAGRLAPA